MSVAEAISVEINKEIKEALKELSLDKISELVDEIKVLNKKLDNQEKGAFGIEEACRYVSLGRKSFKKLVEEGEIIEIKTSDSPTAKGIYPKSSLDNWLENGDREIFHTAKVLELTRARRKKA